MIADILNNGIAFDPKNWQQTSMIDADSITILLSLLSARRINYLLVGGVAMLCYVEGRNTQDIDLLMSAEDLSRLPELQVNQRDRDFARATFSGIQIDLLLTDNALFRDVLVNHAGVQSFGEATLSCVTPAGLILLKLYALPSLYRQGQFQRANLYEGDITALLLQFPELGDRISELLKVLKLHLIESDVNAIAEVIQDIRQRLARMR